MAEFRTFKSREALSAAVADHICDTLCDAIEKQGNATIVVSGGTSPLAMFRDLRRKVMPWQNVTIVPGDERLVPADHENSNEGMIRRELMQEEAASAQLLSLAGAGATNDERIINLNSQLDDLRKPLDLVVLGMGNDGHTASLFPDSPNIAEALNCKESCIVQYPKQFEVGRMSLTPALLLNAREIILLFFDTGKRVVYDRAISGQDTTELPVRFVLHQKIVPVITFWAP